MSKFNLDILLKIVIGVIKVVIQVLSDNGSGEVESIN